MNKCSHIICRTTAPCRYGSPALPDPVHIRRTVEVSVRRAEQSPNEVGGNDFPPQVFPV